MKRPLPALDDANAPFWAGARASELRLQRCRNCGVFRFPAAQTCGACRGTESDWVATSGRGAIDSFCIFHKAYFPGFETPYNVAVIALDEGVKLFSNVVGVANDAIRIGQRVEAAFERATDDVTLVKFRPVTT